MTYVVGGHKITVNLFCGDKPLDKLLPSFASFKTEDGGEKLFTLDVCEHLEALPSDERRLIREVDTGNGITQVSKLNDGGYQFVVRNIDDEVCALIICNEDFSKCRCMISGGLSMMRFGLNNTLMLVYAFSAARRDTLLVHASVVRHNGVAYAFTAKSGTGKSTQVANWIRNIEGCDIVNDDNPIFRFIDGKAVLYGSPWSGKTPCYRNITVPLAALMLIKRDERNYVKEQNPIIAFSTLLTACSAMKWDETLFEKVCGTVSRIVENIKVAELHCTPDAESAFVCRRYLEDDTID